MRDTFRVSQRNYCDILVQVKVTSFHFNHRLVGIELSSSLKLSAQKWLDDFLSISICNEGPFNCLVFSGNVESTGSFASLIPQLDRREAFFL